MSSVAQARIEAAIGSLAPTGVSTVTAQQAAAFTRGMNLPAVQTSLSRVGGGKLGAIANGINLAAGMLSLAQGLINVGSGMVSRSLNRAKDAQSDHEKRVELGCRNATAGLATIDQAQNHAATVVEGIAAGVKGLALAAAVPGNPLAVFLRAAAQAAVVAIEGILRLRNLLCRKIMAMIAKALAPSAVRGQCDRPVTTDPKPSIGKAPDCVGAKPVTTKSVPQPLPAPKKETSAPGTSQRVTKNRQDIADACPSQPMSAARTEVTPAAPPAGQATAEAVPQVVSQEASRTGLTAGVSAPNTCDIRPATAAVRAIPPALTTPVPSWNAANIPAPVPQCETPSTPPVPVDTSCTKQAVAPITTVEERPQSTPARVDLGRQSGLLGCVPTVSAPGIPTVTPTSGYGAAPGITPGVEAHQSATPNEGAKAVLIPQEKPGLSRACSVDETPAAASLAGETTRQAGSGYRLTAAAELGVGFSSGMEPAPSLGSTQTPPSAAPAALTQTSPSASDGTQLATCQVTHQAAAAPAPTTTVTETTAPLPTAPPSAPIGAPAAPATVPVASAAPASSEQPPASPPQHLGRCEAPVEPAPKASVPNPASSAPEPAPSAPSGWKPDIWVGVSLEASLETLSTPQIELTSTGVEVPRQADAEQPSQGSTSAYVPRLSNDDANWRGHSALETSTVSSVKDQPVVARSGRW